MPSAVGRPMLWISVIHAHHGGDARPAGAQPELGGLLDAVHRVGAAVGEGQHLGARGLGLQQVGREVGRAERRAGGAEHLAPGRLHHLGHVACQRRAEGVVGGDEEPGLETLRQERMPHSARERVGVVGPVDVVRAARNPGHLGRGGRRHQRDLVLVPHQLGGAERERRGWKVVHRVHAGVEPLAQNGKARVGLELEVGRTRLDRDVRVVPGEIGDRELGRVDGTGTRHVLIRAGQVGNGPELDDRSRGRGAAHQGWRQRCRRCRGQQGPARKLCRQCRLLFWFGRDTGPG